MSWFSFYSALIINIIDYWSRQDDRYTTWRTEFLGWLDQVRFLIVYIWFSSVFSSSRDFNPSSHPSPPVPSSPNRMTPVPILDKDYIKMLKEAQREYSARSSARVSPISSAMMSLQSTCKNTPSTSPKSPPNSPNVELADFKDLKEQLKKQGVFINREPEPTMDDILTHADWRSR